MSYQRGAAQQQQEIILLNNQGATLMQMGDIDGAIEVLADALNAVKRVTQTTPKRDRQQNLELSEWFTECMETTTTVKKTISSPASGSKSA